MEKKKPSFVRRPVTPPPEAQEPVQPKLDLPKDQPLPSGQVMLTDWTKKQLEALGWKEGDPIPGDIGKRIQKLQQDIQQEIDNPDYGFEKGQRTKVGKVMDITELSPEKQSELAKHLQQYKEDMAQQAVVDAANEEIEAQVNPNAHPSVQQAQRQALQMDRRQQIMQQQQEQLIQGAAASPNMPTVQLKRKQSQQTDYQPAKVEPQVPSQHNVEQALQNLPPQLQPRAGSVVAGMEGVADFVTNPIPDHVDAAQAEEHTDQIESPSTDPVDASNDESEEAVSAGGTLDEDRCPRCLYPRSLPFEVEPTLLDKQEYVASILGLSRFEKTYSLMGGKLKVTLRSLTSDEVDIVFQQLRLDSYNGDILSEAEYMTRLAEYRLVLSIAGIYDEFGATVAECPPMLEVAGCENFLSDRNAGVVEETPIPQIKNWFNHNMVTQESLRRQVAQLHREFQRLLEALEARTSDTDFWKPTAPQS